MSDLQEVALVIQPQKQGGGGSDGRLAFPLRGRAAM